MQGEPRPAAQSLVGQIPVAPRRGLHGRSGIRLRAPAAVGRRTDSRALIGWLADEKCRRGAVRARTWSTAAPTDGLAALGPTPRTSSAGSVGSPSGSAAASATRRPGRLRHCCEGPLPGLDSAADPAPRLYGTGDADFDGAAAEQALVRSARPSAQDGGRPDPAVHQMTNLQWVPALASNCE